MKHTVYIGLGSNIEPRAETLISALRALDRHADTEVRRISQFYQTDPVGGPEDQPVYLNAAAEIATSLEPEELLDLLQQVEAELGRDRSREVRWGPRTCDLDLLLYDDRTVETPRLSVPHPRLHERLFVLRPLAEIAGEVLHPARNETILDLLIEAELAK